MERLSSITAYRWRYGGLEPRLVVVYEPFEKPFMDDKPSTTASRWRYGGILSIPQPIVGATGGWVPLDAEDQTPWWWPMFTGYRGVADVPTPLA